MVVEFPQIDQIIHASLEEEAYSQREYVHLMNQCNNFINLTFQEYLDRISREYNPESIICIFGNSRPALYNSFPSLLLGSDR